LPLSIETHRKGLRKTKKLRKARNTVYVVESMEKSLDRNLTGKSVSISHHPSGLLDGKGNQRHSKGSIKYSKTGRMIGLNGLLILSSMMD
jgi:hypothetical protein